MLSNDYRFQGNHLCRLTSCCSTCCWTYIFFSFADEKMVSHLNFCLVIASTELPRSQLMPAVNCAGKFHHPQRKFAANYTHSNETKWWTWNCDDRKETLQSMWNFFQMRCLAVLVYDVIFWQHKAAQLGISSEKVLTVSAILASHHHSTSSTPRTHQSTLHYAANRGYSGVTCALSLRCSAYIGCWQRISGCPTLID